MQIAGEISKLLSPEFKFSHPEADWASLARYRDRLIHGFHRVDLHQLWQSAVTAQDEIMAALDR